MGIIRPKTYKEIMAFEKALKFRSNCSPMSDELFYKIYEHIKTPGNVVSASDNTLLMRDVENNIVFSCAMTLSSTVEYMILTSQRLTVKVPSSSGSGYSGSSGNNNNNNNNNG